MADKRNTKGVFCLFCGQAIPLHPRLASLALSQRETRAGGGVMILHCRTCCKDAPYSIRELIPLDFAPEPNVTFK